MIKSFLEYIVENKGFTPDSTLYVDDIINTIKKINDESDSYVEAGRLEYKDPHTFDIIVEVKVNSNPNFETDEHFKKLPWEEMNFNRYGFSIDANTQMDNKVMMIPEIIITVVLDPSKIDTNELKYKLIDIVQHEIDHTLQFGWNRQAFKSEPSDMNTRVRSKNGYQYFLLPDEIEAMVDGMYKRSKEQDVPLDHLIIKYLTPFIKGGMISDKEFDMVLEEWVKYALEMYPDANISDDNEYISKLIDNI